MLLILGILIVSCKKNESTDDLTEKTWKLDNGILSSTQETLKFSTNGIYQIESQVYVPRSIAAIKGTISGTYTRHNNLINFTKTKVDLPNDTTTIPDSQYQTISGKPIGSFYGYIIKNDSSSVVSGSIRYSNLINSGEFQTESTDERTWEIISLTNDSLIVKDNDMVIKYHK